MTRARRFIGLAGGVATATLALIVLAPPASAGLPVLAKATISITYTSTTFSVCPNGDVDDGDGSGLWVFEVHGGRDDGTTIETKTIVEAPSYSQPCYPIAKYAAARGGFVASLTYVVNATAAQVAEEGSTAGDVIAAAAGEGSWNPNNANTLGT